MQARATVVTAVIVVALGGARAAEAACIPTITIGDGAGTEIPPTGVLLAESHCGGGGAILLDANDREWTATRAGTYEEIHFHDLPAGHADALGIRGGFRLRVNPTWRRPVSPPRLVAVEHQVSDSVCAPSENAILVLDRGAAGVEVRWAHGLRRMRVPVHTRGGFRALVTLLRSGLSLGDEVELLAIEADGSLTPIIGGRFRLLPDALDPLGGVKRQPADASDRGALGFAAAATILGAVVHARRRRRRRIQIV